MDLPTVALASVERDLGAVANVVHLSTVSDADRLPVLRSATALISRNTDKELRTGEAQLIQNARLVQFIHSGLDFVRLDQFPEHVPIASNRGANSAAIAEHAMAMALAASKRLPQGHAELRRGTFNSTSQTRAVRGAVCGILGLGGIGMAIASLARAFGMEILAVRRSTTPDRQAVGFIDRVTTVESVDDLLIRADVLMICIPLTHETRGLIGADRLLKMKDDSIIVNVARGEIVDEDALYAHLCNNPRFFACMDAWWVEPARHGRFELRHPFLELPNFIGSPHCASRVPDALQVALRQASMNVLRALQGRSVLNLVGPGERRSSLALDRQDDPDHANG